MTDLTRRPWTDVDDRRLIDLWPRIGSIVLIALDLERSSSSVQTRASRLGLPRRTEGNERHRRKWTKEDVEKLETSAARWTGDDDSVSICEIAEEVGRSIDAVASRLSENLGGEEILFSRIKVTKRLIKAAPKPKQDSDPRKVGRRRPCMCCQRVFWSEGAHNRLCASCKRDEGGHDWDW